MEKIFSLALSGLGANRIRKILIAEKIPTPGWLQYQRHGKYAHVYEDAPEEKAYEWPLCSVKAILKDETYIGNTIHYRRTALSYKNKRMVRGNEDTILRIKGTQEPIISKEDFETVQQMIKSRRRERKDGTVSVFAGLMRCPDCGWTLSFTTNKRRNGFRLSRNTLNRQN